MVAADDDIIRARVGQHGVHPGNLRRAAELPSLALVLRRAAAGVRRAGPRMPCAVRAAVVDDVRVEHDKVHRGAAALRDSLREVVVQLGVAPALAVPAVLGLAGDVSVVL